MLRQLARIQLLSPTLKSGDGALWPSGGPRAHSCKSSWSDSYQELSTYYMPDTVERFSPCGYKSDGNKSCGAGVGVEGGVQGAGGAPAPPPSSPWPEEAVFAFATALGFHLREHLFLFCVGVG